VRTGPLATFAIVLALRHGAGAAPPPPSATSATNALLGALADGTVPVARLIDPTKGVRVQRGDTTRLACGKELLDVAVEIGVRLRYQTSLASCRNAKNEAICTFDQSALELRFDRTHEGLVLRAFAQSPLGSAPAPGLASSCTDVGPVPLPPPVLARERRDTPGKGKSPTVATLAILHHLEVGDWSLSDYADLERGLVVIEFPSDPGDEGPPPGDEIRRICGAALKAELPAIQRTVAAELKQIEGDQEPHCTNDARTGTAQCSFGPTGEWSPSRQLRFRQADKGLVLDAVVAYGDHVMNGREAYEVTVEQALAHAWAEPCPAVR
jgi:hypothetical protein